MLVLGVVSMVLGAMVLLWPGKTIPVIEWAAGGYLALSAGVQVALAVGARFALALRALLVISALLTVVLAVFCVQGGNSVPTVSMWLGVGFALRGVTQATVSVWDDRLADPGRHELAGLLTLVVGIALLLTPVETMTAFGWVAGGALILLGAADFALAGIGRGETRTAWSRRGPVHPAA